MNKLALTTNQMRAGLLINTDSGPVFVSLFAAAAVVLAYAAGIAARLAVSTIEAEWLLVRLVVVNAKHYAGLVMSTIKAELLLAQLVVTNVQQHAVFIADSCAVVAWWLFVPLHGRF